MPLNAAEHIEALIRLKMGSVEWSLLNMLFLNFKLFTGYEYQVVEKEVLKLKLLKGLLDMCFLNGQIIGN